MRSDRYKFVRTEVVAAAADTQYSFIVPEGAINLEIKLADAAIAWRWSHQAGEVATPTSGHPMAAGTGIGSGTVEHHKQTIYLAHSDGSSQTFKIAFMVPHVR